MGFERTTANPFRDVEDTAEVLPDSIAEGGIDGGDGFGNAPERFRDRTVEIVERASGLLGEGAARDVGFQTVVVAEHCRQRHTLAFGGAGGTVVVTVNDARGHGTERDTPNRS